jgi:hypothetical protein
LPAVSSPPLLGALCSRCWYSLTRCGLLSSSFLTEFAAKWTDTGLPTDQGFLESPDLSALTELGSTVAVVNRMRWMSGG